MQKHGLKARKPEHWHELHIGMAALGIARGAYVAVCKDDEAIYIERIRLDVEEADRQEARIERLVAAHEAPLKFAENAERPPCRFCRHRRAGVWCARRAEIACRAACYEGRSLDLHQG